MHQNGIRTCKPLVRSYSQFLNGNDHLGKDSASRDSAWNRYPNVQFGLMTRKTQFSLAINFSPVLLLIPRYSLV